MNNHPEDHEQCQWKIRWTFDTDAQCELRHHIDDVVIQPGPGGRFTVQVIGDGLPDTDEHRTHVGPNNATEMVWHAGDRREFLGDWPGPCLKTPHCTLHTGHHGRCAT